MGPVAAQLRAVFGPLSLSEASALPTYSGFPNLSRVHSFYGDKFRAAIPLLVGTPRLSP
jgi:hypothetical protein